MQQTAKKAVPVNDANRMEIFKCFYDLGDVESGTNVVETSQTFDIIEKFSSPCIAQTKI